MTRKLTGNVTLSKHALHRWRLRVNPKARVASICGRLKNRIASELKKGAEVNSRGALEIEVVPGVWAICYPSLMGGWEVATIIKEGWEEDMEERAQYAEPRKMTDDEYLQIQHQLTMMAQFISDIDLEGFMARIEEWHRNVEEWKKGRGK